MEENKTCGCSHDEGCCGGASHTHDHEGCGCGHDHDEHGCGCEEHESFVIDLEDDNGCLLYTSPSPRDA